MNPNENILPKLKIITEIFIEIITKLQCKNNIIIWD